MHDSLDGSKSSDEKQFVISNGFIFGIYQVKSKLNMNLESQNVTIKFGDTKISLCIRILTDGGNAMTELKQSFIIVSFYCSSLSDFNIFYPIMPSIPIIKTDASQNLTPSSASFSSSSSFHSWAFPLL